MRNSDLHLLMQITELGCLNSQLLTEERERYGQDNTSIVHFNTENPEDTITAKLSG